MRIRTLAALLLTFAVDAGAQADVQGNLPRSHDQLGGGLALFAATVVDGGGVGGSNKNPPRATIEVSEEFPRQHLAPGRIPIARQEAVFRILAGSPAEDRQRFEVPTNGTRFIAFGDPSKPPLIVYANHVFADTAANGANIAAGRLQPSTIVATDNLSDKIQLALFVASLGVAFASIFLPWFRIKYGVIGIAVSVVLWLAYEVQIPTQMNIRFELVFLFPVMLAAVISTVFAAASEK